MFSRLRSDGLSRGLLGGSRTWLVLGAIAWTVRALQWAMRRERGVLVLEVLEPGETMLISSRVGESGRRGRRSRRRRAA